MGVERAGARRRQPRGRLPFPEPHVEQLDGGGSAIDPRDPRREDHLLAVVRPDRHVARTAMKIGDVEKLHHATVAVAVADLPQPRAIGPDDVRMAVVVLPRHEQQPSAVGGPGRREDERVAGVDLLAVATVGIGEPHLVVLVVGDPPPVGGAGEAVGKAGGVTGEIGFVSSIPIHRKRLRDPVDERREPEPAGVAGPGKDAGVVKADAFDGGNILGPAGGEIDQMCVVEPVAGAEAEGLVFLLVARVGLALPGPADDRRLPVGEPADELCRTPRLGGEVGGQRQRRRSRHEEHRPAGDNIGPPPSGERRGVLGVTDRPVRERPRRALWLCLESGNHRDKEHKKHPGESAHRFSAPAFNSSGPSLPAAGCHRPPGS